MNYLLRKLVEKFIILETSNGEVFTGKIIGIFQDALTLEGIKEPSTLISSPPNPSIPNTYNIAINHIIWFREKECDISYSSFDINKSDSIKIVANDLAIENSNQEINKINDNINLLESLFGTISAFVDSDLKDNFNIESKFNVQLDLDFEDNSDEELE